MDVSRKDAVSNHRAVIIGAGRIGAGFNWNDDEYTHAGAYRALSDRVELVGFVEPDLERRVKAGLKWSVPAYDNVAIALEALKPDIVSVCVQPVQQREALISLCGQQQIVGIWCEKPYFCNFNYGWPPIQVNYLRRADPRHRKFAKMCNCDKELVVYAKDDLHTRCHFEDLASWWKVPLKYYPIKEGPCSYFMGEPPYRMEGFALGGIDGGDCMKAMLGNLLDHVDNGTELWSPAA